jgi:hypothetical protein
MMVAPLRSQRLYTMLTGKTMLFQPWMGECSIGGRGFAYYTRGDNEPVTTG